MTDRGRTDGAVLKAGCGCRLKLVETRWVRVVKCGGVDCKARLAGEADPRERDPK